MNPGYATFWPMSMTGVVSSATARTSSRVPTAATRPSSMRSASAIAGLVHRHDPTDDDEGFGRGRGRRGRHAGGRRLRRRRRQRGGRCTRGAAGDEGEHDQPSRQSGGNPGAADDPRPMRHNALRASHEIGVHAPPQGSSVGWLPALQPVWGRRSRFLSISRRISQRRGERRRGHALTGAVRIEQPAEDQGLISSESIIACSSANRWADVPAKSFVSTSTRTPPTSSTHMCQRWPGP